MRPHQFAKNHRTRRGRRYFQMVLLLGAASVVSPPRAALADDTAEDFKQLRAAIQKELADLKKREQKLHQEFLRLDQKSELLDEQLRKLRAAGVGPGGTNPSATAGGVARPAGAEGSPKPAAVTEVTQTAAAQPAPEVGAAASTAPPAVGESAPISGPSAEERQTRQVVETAPTLSSVGGVLTPKGQIVIDPSIEYDYWSQNQLGVNGFQIIPGITFGNVFATRFEQNIMTGAVTVRGGVTDRLELNVKIPYVYNAGSTSSLIPLGTSAQLLSVGADGAGLGDIQFGASYQFNSAESGWPIFVGNFLFKTVTGTSPYQVPIITVNDPNGQFLAGTPKKLSTGTGFYTLTPSVTLLLPTAPGVLFANLQFQHNLARTQPVRDRAGRRATPINLQPGESPAITFGIGFALNDRAALTLSYQQTHVFTAYSDGQPITGSSYSYGTFNFGLGYQISQSTRFNLSIGIGAGPNTPAARVLFELPYKFYL
jgi:cell division protein FtsB